MPPLGHLEHLSDAAESEEAVQVLLRSHTAYRAPVGADSARTPDFARFEMCHDAPPDLQQHAHERAREKLLPYVELCPN